MLALLNFRSSLREVVFCVFFTENLDEAMSCTDENHWIHDLTHLLIAVHVMAHAFMSNQALGALLVKHLAYQVDDQMLPPPNWEENSESELEPELKERPWKRGRFDLLDQASS